MTSLIFKFRDDLFLQQQDQAMWLNEFQLPHTYFSEAQTFFLNDRLKQGRPIKTINPKNNPTTPKLDPKSVIMSQFFWLKLFLSYVVGAKPRFLFGDTDISPINTLWGRLNTYESNQPLPRPSMPNLFNYFRLDFPPDFEERKIQSILNLIGLLLPHNRSTDPELCLLEYAYVKDDPVPTTDSNYSEKASDAAGQLYFSSMQLPNYTDIKPLTDCNLTIVEADSWDLSHPQFEKIRAKTTIICPSPDDVTLSKIGPGSGRLDHGTQILGILGADPTNLSDSPANNADFCRGIVPQASFRLASCLSKGTKIEGDSVDTIRYAEEYAVLIAVSATQSGETILLEVATGGGRFPLDVLPAVYELINIAYRLDITVVAGAGNGDDKGVGAIIDQVPPNQIRSLMPRDFRAAVYDILAYEQDDHAKSYWNVSQDMHGAIIDLAQQHAITPPGKRPNIELFLLNYQATPSKAILVGAADYSVSTKQFTLLPNSSRGNRVTLFAQGSHILTTNPISPTNPNNNFYNAMGNTSGASAIVAGMIVLAQSMAKAANRVIPPATIHEWLQHASGFGVEGLPRPLIGTVPYWPSLHVKLIQWLKSPPRVS